jgi:dihydrolipoamide dehydrogenase
MGDPIRITVIGSGVGGYPPAIRAARMGASVTVVEKDLTGGVCLNWGCIPTKSLLQSAEVATTIRESEKFGIKCADSQVDFTAVMKRKASVVQQLRTGVEKLLRAKKIRMVKGTASLLDASTIEIAETGEKIKGDRVIIATGSSPVRLPIPGAKGPGIWNSDDFLQMKSLPKSAVIVGGGVVGVEFAQILHRFGVRVTILEMMDHLIPGADTEIALALQGSIEAEGISVFTQAIVEKISHLKSQHTVTFRQNGAVKTCEGEKVVIAAGRKPDLSQLHVERAGLAHENGVILVNDRMETNVPGIYAAGDAVGGIMLAHVATAEGECAALNAMGHKKTMHYKAIPSCIYTAPEVASVGLTEEAAKEKHDVQVGRFPFHGCGKAMILDQTYGMVKVVSEKRYGEVLGVHMIGPHATDLIAEAVLGISMEMTVEELAEAVHPHPTLSEALMEAAQTLHGGPIHMP